MLAGDVITDRVLDAIYDLRAGTRTGGLVPIESLIADWAGSHDYYPTTVRTFQRLMSYVELDPGKESFVDIGSGKGRVLILAATYAFRRIYGYEISEKLVQIAKQNLGQCRGRLLCSDISIVTGDAGKWPFPSDATVFFLYNPCHGEQLERIMGGIKRSFHDAPRRLTILFNNIRHFEEMEGHHQWLRPIARLRLEHDCAVFRAEA